MFARDIRRDAVSLHFWRDELKPFDLFPELTAIVCPTLILGGELDPITTVADFHDLARRFQDPI
jgi:proline iminopeptidase